MRELYLGRQFLGEDLSKFLERSFRTLEEASHEDAMVIADGYTITNAPATPVRTLDPTTATLSQLAAFVATFIGDLQKRTINRVE